MICLHQKTVTWAGFWTGLRAEKEAEPIQDLDGHTYYRQLALNVSDWTDIGAPRDEREANPLDGVTFEQFMDEVETNLKDTLDHYEEREAQTQMFGSVSQALDEEKHLLIEAGTGTGKSLGYLLPAIYESVKQEQKVMVSTHTINLQEQLRERDIPMLTQGGSVPV